MFKRLARVIEKSTAFVYVCVSDMDSQCAASLAIRPFTRPNFIMWAVVHIHLCIPLWTPEHTVADHFLIYICLLILLFWF